MSRIRLSGLIWAGSIALACAGVLFSQNLGMWVTASLVLALAVWAAGPAGEKPVVIAHLGLFWTAVFGGLLARELQGQSPDDFETLAIALSLAALLVIALGYRIGFRLFRRRSDAVDVGLNRNKLLIAYWAAFTLTFLIEIVAYFIPALTQPILAMSGIKLLLLYLLCAQSFKDQAGQIWLAPVVLAEFVNGAVGYIASYQIPLLVILAASLNAQQGRVSARQIIGGVLTLGLLIWASLVWTAIKPDFRDWLATSPTTETESGGDRFDWISNRLAHGIDYDLALTGLVNRIGYTELYSNALPRMDSVHSDFWLEAIKNVLTPRVLFPDKAALDDTAITTALTGRRFGRTASVSIGYVAQAHADFGVPGMFIPLLLLGFTLGGIGSFFQSRNCAPIAQDGFMTAALVFKFGYESNIDKALGALVLSTLALLVVFRFGYKPFERWASVHRRPFPGGRLATRVANP